MTCTTAGATSDGDRFLPSPYASPSNHSLTLLPLSDPEKRRYGRQVLLPEVGIEGQERLQASRVLIVGAGGLGSPLALYLAAAGVGHISLVDDDVVDESNLHRQPLHGTADVGRSKLDSALERLKDLNPHISVTTHAARFTSENAMGLLQGHDVIADGTDNFQTRYLVNDASVLSGVPNVHASVFRFEGQVSVFGAPGGPCYRCLYPEPPPPGLVPSCAEGGVLGVLPGTVGTLQATEVLKLLLGIGTPLIGRLLLYDALSANFDTVSIQRDPGCPLCGDQPSIDKLIDYDAFCGLEAVPEMTVVELNDRQARDTAPYLLDVREPEELQLASIGGTLIPLGELSSRLHELNRDEELVVYCRTGVRSAQAVRLLQDHGFGRAQNLKGGLRAWSLEIDPEIPIY
ncbi:MAG: molybdopterin-synthase adenylyltransferase MoeB [Rhodothermales bacterium]|nr:molybdopterin-synthase adenylyltransferase MoeB [Rhodothermales bacterium]